jgi:predicted metal-dependent hydrolase
MDTERRRITVGGVAVEVVRKPIKNLHLGVYPPNGRVRVAAPLSVSDEAVRLAVVERLAWVKRQKDRFAAQARQSRRDMVTGETHYYLGRRYRLRVIEHAGPPRVALRGTRSLDLYVRPGLTAEQRERILHDWYRARLKEAVPPILAKWEEALGVTVAAWGVRKMKTKWGSCNPETRRVWLNLELAKKPVQCLDYLILHELVHLLERRHTDRFTALMDRHLPDWRLRRDELNAAPLAHEAWEY